jgi:hypothetical protein
MKIFCVDFRALRHAEVTVAEALVFRVDMYLTIWNWVVGPVVFLLGLGVALTVDWLSILFCRNLVSLSFGCEKGIRSLTGNFFEPGSLPKLEKT